MNGWCSLGFIGCLFVGAIYCQDSNPPSVDVDQHDDSDVEVKLYVDTQPKSSHVDTEKAATVPNSTIAQSPETLTCHECTNCNVKSTIISRVCESGIDMCYTIHKSIDDTSRIIRRGCATLKGQCTVPNDDQSDASDSVTCCRGHKCNRAIHVKPLFLLSVLSLFIIIYI